MNKQKTLLFYINAIHDGGAERVILQLAKHFANNGYKSVLVTSFVDDNEYPVPENVLRITLEEKNDKKSFVSRNISRIVKLRRICKEVRPLGVISFMGEPNIRIILATIGLHLKRIVSIRNDPRKEYPGFIGKFLAYHLVAKADGGVFQTEEAKEWFPLRFQNKSTVIMNDVDSIFFETDRIPGGKIVVNMGRLCDQKNQALLINAFAKAVEKHPDYCLRIYGIGPLKEQLEEQISSKKITDKIELMGLTNDAPNVLAHADIFVLSSNYEGMPNALLEALAIGVPSISTDCPCGGPKTIIKNKENGILIPVNDERALEESLCILMDNPIYANNLGNQAREDAKNYRPEIVFEKWKSYIEQVIM